MPDQKIAFREIGWEIVAEGVREKRFEQNGSTMRLLEISRSMNHPEWCLTGHYGYVVEGDLEIVFETKTESFSRGDGIFIRSGESEKHIPNPITGKVILFLVDEI